MQRYLLPLVATLAVGASGDNFDLIVFGGTAGGVIAAVAVSSDPNSIV